MSVMTTISLMSSDITTITVSKQTHARLTNLGAKNESYDDILSRVLEKVDA
jgi:hypothetical protein